MSKRVNFAMSIRLIGGAFLGGVLALGSVKTASAQIYGGFYARSFAYPHPGFFPEAPVRAPMHRSGFVLAVLAEQGYEPIAIVGRRRDVLIVEAFSPKNERVRLIVDAYDGDILERFMIRPGPSPSAPAGGVTDNRRRDPARELNGIAPRKTPEKLAELPIPPRRPVIATAPIKQAAPKLAPTPRRLDDWAPINSVPVAPLD